jgi:hypothetical protein
LILPISGLAQIIVMIKRQAMVLIPNIVQHANSMVSRALPSGLLRKIVV